MKRIACIAAMAAMMLSGCGKNASESVPNNSGAYTTEKLFDYFYSDDMPWGETKKFTLPEFSDVSFKWNDERVMAVNGGKETKLFWGMPVWSVYLADLNGDGKREICSTVSMGSGMVDERIYAYDYANGKLYKLEDRFHYNYCLELRDGVLVYVKTPERTPDHSDSEELTEVLTLEKMTEVDEVRI